MSSEEQTPAAPQGPQTHSTKERDLHLSESKAGRAAVQTLTVMGALPSPSPDIIPPLAQTSNNNIITSAQPAQAPATDTSSQSTSTNENQ